MSSNDSLDVALRKLSLGNAEDKVLIAQIGSKENPATDADLDNLQEKLAKFLNGTGMRFLVLDHKPCFKLMGRKKDLGAVKLQVV